MTRLLHVLIILLTTFSQTRNLPGNTVHDFAHTDYINVMISIDLAAGSSNPAAPSCDVSVGQGARFHEAFDDDYITWTNRRKHAITLNVQK